jgi:putative ABC transport system permease protein
MRADAPAPVFSELPANLVEEIREVPGVRIVAPEVWRIAPPIEGRNQLARAAAKALASRGDERFSSFAETIVLEGEQLPEHLLLRGGAFKHSLLSPQRGGGRYVLDTDVGKAHVVIGTKIAREIPCS